MRRISCVLWVVLFEASSVYSFPFGAPSEACSSLTPIHGGSPQSFSLPYTLDLSTFNLYNDENFYYEPGNTYQCKENSMTVQIHPFENLVSIVDRMINHMYMYAHMLRCLASLSHRTQVLYSIFALLNSDFVWGHFSRISVAGKATGR